MLMSDAASLGVRATLLGSKAFTKHPFAGALCFLDIISQ